MPLKQSSSDKAFKQNLKTEMKHGKPQKQALAIAYSTKRANMAKGGKVKGCPDCMAMGGKCYAHGGQISKDSQKSNVADSTERTNLAEGGEVDNEKLHPEHEAGTPDVDPGISSEEDSDLEKDFPTVSEALSLSAEVMKDRQRRKMAEGGEVDDMHEMVSKRPMSKNSVESYEGEETESSQVGDDDPSSTIDPPTGRYETKDSDEMDSPKESNRMLESRGLNAARPHIMSDEEHDSSNPSEDDLVSQILQDRKKRRRGM